MNTNEKIQILLNEYSLLSQQSSALTFEEIKTGKTFTDRRIEINREINSVFLKLSEARKNL